MTPSLRFVPPKGSNLVSKSHRVWFVVLGLLLLGGELRGREVHDLGGEWERWIGLEKLDHVMVPSSYRPVGTARLRRVFDMQMAPGQSAVLRFEGVAHQGVVRLNGLNVGSMGPWTPYQFDVSRQVRPGANELEVEVTDWQVPLGPIGAWEAYGGIIRPVYLELRSNPYLQNARLSYRLGAARTQAECKLDVWLHSDEPMSVAISADLMQKSRSVSRTSRDIQLGVGSSNVSLSFSVETPALWSPENPNLYQVRVGLKSMHGEDQLQFQTGFRQLEIRGDQFFLNGERLILRGLCRHDLWENQGHTLTSRQIEEDLQRIKATGANFVRLVHYPHDKRVVETADRLGLLVTEESGLVWVDFRKLTPEVVEIGIQNLERTIRRDWNSPSLFAVLLANESAPTLDAVQQARARVKALAPELFMSSARIDSPEETFEGAKRLFDEGGLDFYTYHPYTYEMNLFEETAKGLAGKPLVFTEWGGRAVGQSPILMQETIGEISKLVEAGRLAGHSFWSWADLPEFSRGGSEMEGGILKSGVVTEGRVPRPDVFLALAELFRRLPAASAEPSRAPDIRSGQVVPLSIASRFTPVHIQPLVDSPDQAKAWTDLEGRLEEFWKSHSFTRRHWEETGRRFWLWNAPRLQIGGIPFETALVQGKTQPLVLTSRRPKVELELELEAERLHFLGNVTLPDGYPIVGRQGEEVGHYTLVYADGEKQKIPLRWGVEIARSNMIMSASRVDPSTTKGQRVLTYTKDPTREVYQARLLSVDLRPKPVRRLVCDFQGHVGTVVSPPHDTHHDLSSSSQANDQVFLLFAITAEKTTGGSVE
ncbi:MAG: glycoside hydrolase family 2 TIM barrel-domain containing protein [Acidobacteriota bacterium]